MASPPVLLALCVSSSSESKEDAKRMNSYIVNILFQSENSARTALEAYKSQVENHKNYLEIALSLVFRLDACNRVPEISIGSIEKKTNELEIGCIGSKHPSFDLGVTLRDLAIDGPHAIRLETIHDDGSRKKLHLVNGRKCTRSKFDSFYNEIKIKDSGSSTHTKKKLAAPKSKPQEKSHDPKGTPSFNYNKHRESETAIIRLQVRRKLQRAKIRDMFEKIIGLAPKRRVDKFSLDFDLMVDSETQEVRWCKLRLEDGDRWFLGPENLICGLVFVLEQDNFLYLGFDLQGLNLHGERPVERDLLHLILIFNSIDGVN